MEASFLVFIICLSCCSSLATGKLTCDPVDSSTTGSCEYSSGCNDSPNSAIERCWPHLGVFSSSAKSMPCDGGEPDINNITVTISYKLVPVSVYEFKLSVHLPRVSGIHQYQVNVRLGENGHDRETCTGETTTYEQVIQYHRSRMIKLEVLAYPGGPKFAEQFPNPQTCADEQLRYDADTCGLPQLQRPQWIAAIRNKTHATLTWDKAVSYILPGSYDAVWVNINRFYLTVFNMTGNILVKMAEFNVTNTTEVAINTTDPIGVILRAFYSCSGIYERNNNSVPTVECSSPRICRISDNHTVCGDMPQPASITPSSTALTSTLPSTPTNLSAHDDQYTPVYITAGVAGGIVVLVAIVASLIIVYARRFSSKKGRSLIPNHTPSPSPPPQHSALVFYTPSTSDEEERNIVEAFAYIHRLPNQSGFDPFLQITRKPQHTLVHWINIHYDKAQAVIFVCNRIFKSEWEEKIPSPEVQTLRLLFEGQLGSKDRKKYAVVLTKPSDEVFIPSLLKALPRFHLFDTETLVKYIRNEESPV